MFGYPKRLEEKKEEKKKRVETVTLSTTAKNKTRIARKRAKEDAKTGMSSSPMDVKSKRKERLLSQSLKKVLLLQMITRRKEKLWILKMQVRVQLQRQTEKGERTRTYFIPNLES